MITTAFTQHRQAKLSFISVLFLGVLAVVIATGVPAALYGSHARAAASPISAHLTSNRLVAQDPSGTGYWIASSDGGVFALGGAPFYGSMAGHHLNAPIVGLAATPDGGGYWLIGADGGVYAFGDAAFSGSLANMHLNTPVVGIASSTPTGSGTPGPPGPQGASGISGYQVVTNVVNIAPGSGGAIAFCPSGLVPLGGGFANTGAQLATAGSALLASAPITVSGRSGWGLTLLNGGTTSFQVTVYATCAVVAP